MYPMVALGDNCCIKTGYAFNSKLFNTTSSGMPIIRIRDVGKNLISTYFNGEYDTDYLINSGDVLISMDGEFRISKWEGEKALLNQRVCKINTKNHRLDLAYTVYFLKVELKKIEDKTPFATVKHLSNKTLKAITIPAPSLTTQQKIAAILDQAQALIDYRKQQIVQLDQLAQSTFLEMFSQLTFVETKPLKSVCDFIDYRGISPQKSGAGIPLITAKNIRYGYVSQEPQEFLDISTYDKWVTRGIPIAGDVLFTTEAPLGHAAILPKHEDKIVIAQRVIALRPSSKNLNNYYLLFHLLSSPFQQELMKRSTGSTVKGIRSKELEKISIPLPPLTKQAQFASIIENIEAQKSQLQQSLGKLEMQFNALMQRAFNGKLIPE